MKKALIFCTSLLLLSCGFYYQNSTNLNHKTKYFRAPKKNIRVLTEKSVNADTLKLLLIVKYNGEFEIANNLNFFDEVLTIEQFENEIIKEGIANDISSIRNKKGLNKAATLFRPFVILERVYGQNNFNKGLRLYDPRIDQIIFENEMNDGFFSPSNVSKFFPLYNSLLDYLRKQE